jgi:hypothetical protein
VFKKHNAELMKMFIAFKNAHKYTYKKLAADKATWTDFPTKHFVFNDRREFEQYSNLKEWSNSFNDLDNWMNLNSLVAISSNLETFMATVIPLALESDIGILYGTSKRIDGIEIRKYGHENSFDLNNVIIKCTKGNWQSRVNEYKRLFGKAPSVLESSISDLDKIRNIRNEVAHSFGRDIEESRRRMEVTTLPIKKLSDKKFLEYQELTFNVAKEIDRHLLCEHIGEYQMLLYYHELYQSLDKTIHPSHRARAFRKKLGGHLGFAAGQVLSKELVDYYESL